MIKRHAGTALVLLHAVSPAAMSAQMGPDAELPVDPQVRMGQFQNGLRYYVRQNSRPEQRAELRLVVNVGSILEDDDQLGLAHFAEHMAFNGTRHFPKQELIDYLERLGMQFGPHINASTSFDETIYQLRIPTDTAEVMETAFQILEDWARFVTFEGEEIDLERGVVIEEWRGGRGAQSRMLDQQFPVLFRGSRYAERLPIGTPEILESFPHSTLTRFYRTWYRPDLMAVVAVGDFDPDRVEALIREHFAAIPAAVDPEARPTHGVPDHGETLVTIATDPEATGSSVSVYYLHPPEDQSTVGAYRRRLVGSLYNRMLNQRLYEITQEPDAPFLFGSSGQGSLIRAKSVYLLSAAVSDGGILDGLRALMAEAERVARHGFTATELERVKVEMLRGMESAYAEREKTNSARYVQEYVQHFLEGEPFPGIEVEFLLYQQLVPGIGVDEINQLAGAWMTESNRVILANAPEKDGVAVPTEAELLGTLETAAAGVIAPYEDAVSDAPLIADLPTPGAVVAESHVEEIDVTIWELSNGARVLLKPTDFQDDQVLFRGSSPGGHSLVSDEDYIAALTASAVIQRSGLGDFSLVELQKALAGKQAGVQPGIFEIAEGVSGGASPQDLETMFQLVYLYFTAARADEPAFRAFKQQVQASLENVGASPEAAFQDTLTVILAQHHHRARPFTSELLDEMDLERSIAIYRDRFADAGDFTFAFVGNFTLDGIRPLVERYIAGLPATPREETWRDVGITPPDGVVEHTVRRGVEPKSETQLVFSGQGPGSRLDRYVLRSTGEVLELRLRETLRERLGGTYNVAVQSNMPLEPRERYTVSIGFGSAPDRVEELTAAVFAHIDSLQTRGPDPDDVEKVKESQRRAHETNLRQNGYWLNSLISRDRVGADLREILDVPDLVASLTPDAVRDAARRFLNTQRYVRVVLVPEHAN